MALSRLAAKENPVTRLVLLRIHPIHVLALAITPTLASCGAGLKRESSGAVGCPADQITISDEDRGYNDMSWKATCRGRTYYCSGGLDQSTTCTPETSGGSAPAPAAAAPTGCAYDAQCKGDRVCVEGACVAPPSSPTAPR